MAEDGGAYACFIRDTALGDDEIKLDILMYEPYGQGGLALYTHNLCNSIAKQVRVNLRLLTSKPYEFTFNSLFPVSEYLFSVNKNSLHLRYGPLRLSDRFIRYLQWAWCLHKNVKYHYPDIIHFQQLIPVVDHYHLKFLNKKRIVYTVHDVLPHDRRSLHLKKSSLKKIYNIFDHLIVHETNNKDQLCGSFDINPGKVTVIPHGMSLPSELPQYTAEYARTILKLSADNQILLFFGTLRENKGLDIMLKAMPGIIESNPGTVLVIAGNASAERYKKYNNIIKDLGITKNVMEHISYIDPVKLDFYFYAADVVVLPYTSFSSQSGVLAQAYSHCRPVVVSDVGGMGEIVRKDNTGFVVKPDDVKSLSEKTKKILRDEQYRKDIRSRMPGIIQNNYAWDIVARKTLDLYENIC